MRHKSAGGQRGCNAERQISIVGYFSIIFSKKNVLLGEMYFIKMHYDVLTSVERHVVMEGVAGYLQIDGPH